MTVLVGVTIAAIGAVSAIVFAGHRKPRASPTERTPGLRPLLVVGWLYLLVPSLLQVAINGRYEGQFTQATQGRFSGPAVPVGEVLQLAFVGCLIFVALGTLGQRPPSRAGGRALVALLPWLLMAVLAYEFGQRFSPVVFIYPLLMISLARAQPRINEFAILGYLTVGTAAVSVLLGVATNFGTFVSGPLADKAILGSTTLGGPFPHSNTLGVVMVLGAPTVLLIERRWLQWPGLALVAVTIVWSASRTSIVAAILFLIAFIVMRALSNPSARRAAAWVAIAGSATMVVWLPLTTTLQDAFSGRGRVWFASLGRWEHHPWFGSGPAVYSTVNDIYSTVLNGAFYGHNLYVQSLATGGWVMLALTGILVLAASRRSVALLNESPVPFLVMVTFLSASLLEVPVSFWLPDPQAVVGWFVLSMVLFGRPVTANREDETADAQAAPEAATLSV